MTFLRKYLLVVWGVFIFSFFCISGLSASAATVTVTKTGTGQGSVVSSDQSTCALSCSGSSCACMAATGATVRLTEVPGSGSLFGGWSGSCSGGNQTCSFTVPATTAVSVGASFIANTFPLTVTKSEDRSGTVTSTPAGINCGADCTENFNANTSVTLIAAPNASSSLATWSGVSCQGGNNQTGSCTFAMDGAKTATAVFATGHRLTVSKNGNGTVTSSPSGINCGSACSVMFPGTNPSVTLTAVPATGASFTNWGNGASSCGTNASCTLVLNEDKAALATFGTVAATCTGKDSSGTTRTGSCSTTATCSSGTALTEATGCASDKACCYTAPSGETCASHSGECALMTDCDARDGWSSIGAYDCQSHGASWTCCKHDEGGGEPESPQCSGSENPGIVPCGRSCDNPNTENVDETAICTLCHLLLLIQNITTWIFMVMTYIAFAVLVAMGILYIISAGNTQMITLAKGGIKAALYGFAIVLLGWVAINVILMVLADGALGTDTATFSIKTNGSWFEYNCSTKTKYTGTGTSSGSGGGGGGDGGGGKVTCSGCSVDGVSFKKSNEHAAIIQAGEHYKQSPCKLGYSDYRSGNGAHACGISQVVSKWHKATCGFDGSDSDMCYKLSTDRTFDLECGYKVVRSYASNSNCQGIKNLALCYNGGPGHGSCGDKNGGQCYGDRVEAFYNSCK